MFYLQVSTSSVVLSVTPLDAPDVGELVHEQLTSNLRKKKPTRRSYPGKDTYRTNIITPSKDTVPFGPARLARYLSTWKTFCWTVKPLLTPGQL
ncbi:unnamed protein product [Nezara viridula]|uniref:Uncharacterized protein n=1 Tax=Nezara viridula TaxID=85310 RepID=A0A9P0H800_NEZVI|nr:unnamed protein product [Nezara viridula]